MQAETPRDKKGLTKIVESNILCPIPKEFCCEYGKYAQCYLHNYCICDRFEDWNDSKRYNKVPKDL